MAKSRKFFQTTLPTNLLKFPLFEATNLIMQSIALPDAVKGFVTGLVFTTLTLPVTNYRFCKSMELPIDSSSLFKVRAVLRRARARAGARCCAQGWLVGGPVRRFGEGTTAIALWMAARRVVCRAAPRSARAVRCVSGWSRTLPERCYRAVPNQCCASGPLARCECERGSYSMGAPRALGKAPEPTGPSPRLQLRAVRLASYSMAMGSLTHPTPTIPLSTPPSHSHPPPFPPPSHSPSTSLPSTLPLSGLPADGLPRHHLRHLAQQAQHGLPPRLPAPQGDAYRPRDPHVPHRAPRVHHLVAGQRAARLLPPASREAPRLQSLLPTEELHALDRRRRADHGDVALDRHVRHHAGAHARLGHPHVHHRKVCGRVNARALAAAQRSSRSHAAAAASARRAVRDGSHGPTEENPSGWR
jgi:hypothetical protein